MDLRIDCMDRIEFIILDALQMILVGLRIKSDWTLNYETKAQKIVSLCFLVLALLVFGLYPFLGYFSYMRTACMDATASTCSCLENK